MKIKSFLVALSLSGCVTMPVPPQGSLMPPGDAPTTEQMETQLKAYLGRTLKDPGSLQQFKITRAPYHKVWQVNDFSPYRSDWIVCFEYNAKNSYGGYGGVTQGTSIFSYGVLVDAFSKPMPMFC